MRLADLTRGGPGIDAVMPDPPRTSIASLPFQRRKAPGQILVLTRPTADARQVTVAKPLLGYPEILFTGTATFADLEADLDTLSADRTIQREIGLPDPDVLTVVIDVQVKALDGDAAPYLPLYTTSRAFDAASLTLDLAFEDHPTLDAFAAAQPATGPLAVPTARPLRITLTALGRDTPGYFADETSRNGTPVTVDFRAQATAEPDLFVEAEALTALRSFFFQPPPSDNSVASPLERLAAEVDLDQAALTVSGCGGKRTVIACSAALRHTLSPEASSITFASASDLVQRWINVVKFQVARDWTWDGLDLAGITVTRTIQIAGKPDIVEVAGNLRLPRAIGPKARTGISADLRLPARQSTDLIFFDAFDPKPRQIAGKPQVFPEETTVVYALQPVFQGPPAGDPATRSNLLPITTPPSQVPQLQPRSTPSGCASSPGQPRDDNGLAAMQQVAGAQPDSARYLIPIPPDLTPTSPDLFGFFTYEVRIGHSDARWSTAQGRYGPILHVAGVHTRRHRSSARPHASSATSTLKRPTPPPRSTAPTCVHNSPRRTSGPFSTHASARPTAPHGATSSSPRRSSSRPASATTPNAPASPSSTAKAPSQPPRSPPASPNTACHRTNRSPSSPQNSSQTPKSPTHSPHASARPVSSASRRSFPSRTPADPAQPRPMHGELVTTLSRESKRGTT